MICCGQIQPYANVDNPPPNSAEHVCIITMSIEPKLFGPIS